MKQKDLRENAKSKRSQTPPSSYLVRGADDTLFELARSPEMLIGLSKSFVKKP
jgi:hypothetical protein